MMLLYHRPVPAKIPKRRSRAGKPSPAMPFFLPLEAAWKVVETLRLTRHVRAPLQGVYTGKTSFTATMYIFTR